MNDENAKAKRQAAEERDQLAGRCLALRRAGATLAAIAEELRIHPSRVRRLLARRGRALESERKKLGALALVFELDRIDAVFRRCFAIMGSSDSSTEQIIKAANMILKASATRSRLLGLESPQRVAMTLAGPDGETPFARVSDEERAKRIVELFQKAKRQGDEKPDEEER